MNDLITKFVLHPDCPSRKPIYFLLTTENIKIFYKSGYYEEEFEDTKGGAIRNRISKKNRQHKYVFHYQTEKTHFAALLTCFL